MKRASWQSTVAKLIGQAMTVTGALAITETPFDRLRQHWSQAGRFINENATKHHVGARLNYLARAVSQPQVLISHMTFLLPTFASSSLVVRVPSFSAVI